MHHLTQSSLGVPTSLAVNQVSNLVDCQQMSKISFQVNTTAPATSTAQIQVSNDGVNWVSLGTPTALTAGSILVEKIDMAQRYARLSLVVSSGTVTGLSVIFNGKF